MKGSQNDIAGKILAFIERIGLEVVRERIDQETFLPGIRVANGRILVDESKLIYPGDLLHEAGHLALATSKIRSTLNGEVAFPGVRMEPVEAQVMAWSFAAALHIGLDPSVVFHEGGYHGASESLLLNFKLGAYIGINGLEDAGMTVFGDKAVESGLPPYPHMIKWLRD